MNVSVVMAVYNGGERMRRTIESVLAQTYDNFEFLCIDDGSTDGVSGRILDEYAEKDHRLRVVHRENKGVCATLNECYATAVGDYVARIDQDDVFHPQLLEFCVKAVEERGVDFLSFRYSVFKPGDPVFLGDPMADIKELQVWDADRRARDCEGYCKSLTIIHTDTWSHFLRRELAVRHPFHPEWGLTRLFAQLSEPIKWCSTRTVLYYYDAGVETSMSHQIFSVEEMCWDMADIRNIINLYGETVKAGDPYGEWDAVCCAYVMKYLKINYNKIRRSKGKVSERVYRDLQREFAKCIYRFFFVDSLPMKYVAWRHRIGYYHLMIKYRKNIKRVCNV